MGWKGTLRSVGAAMRAAERESRRRHRELERQAKHLAKLEALEQAAYEVEVYENRLDVLRSMHKDCGNVVNWSAAVIAPEPLRPSRSDEHEKRARSAHDNYRPGFFDRLLKREEKRRKDLQTSIGLAIQADEGKFAEATASWEAEHTDWREGAELAKAILANDGPSKLRAIKELDPFSEISNLGSSLFLTLHGNKLIEATLRVGSQRIIPGEIKSLLSSGKLSSKKMPVGQFNDIFQDYVCSCTLRVANELLAVLPDEACIVTAVDEMLNPATGHLEETPVLSAFIPRNTLNRLNMDAIDPSDAMRNFVHNMAFKKNKGFEGVARIDPKAMAL